MRPVFTSCFILIKVVVETQLGNTMDRVTIHHIMTHLNTQLHLGAIYSSQFNLLHDLGGGLNTGGNPAGGSQMESVQRFFTDSHQIIESRIKGNKKMQSI